MDDSLIQSYKVKIERCTFKLEQAREAVTKSKEAIDNLNIYMEAVKKAQALCQNVAMQTQDALKYHVEDIVNLMLQALFGSQYEFKLIFEIKRNKTEARIAVIENEVELDPLFSTGGGLADALSTALRIALLMLSQGNRVLILDEPAKHISASLRPQFYSILKRLSTDMGLQMLIVTHDPACVDIADKEFRVAKKDGKSYITV